MQYVLIALELNIFQKIIKNSWETKISEQTFIEYKHLIMCRHFCIGFINFTVKGKNLLEYTYLFFPHEYKKNDKIILKYFQ